MLLARGKVMYHGPANEALDYFSTIGKFIIANKSIFDIGLNCSGVLLSHYIVCKFT